MRLYKKGDVVQLAKVRDSYVFNKKSSDSHFYFVEPQTNGNVFLRGLTHLYVPDKKRMNQLRSGLLEKVFIDGFDTPSGVSVKKVETTDINGNPMSLSDVASHSVKGIWKRKILK